MFELRRDERLILRDCGGYRENVNVRGIAGGGARAFCLSELGESMARDTQNGDKVSEYTRYECSTDT
jgi:hypothetical protein